MLRALTITVITGVLADVVPALAQDRAVVLVHGFASSGATWEGAAARLQSGLAILPQTPSLSSGALYESQATELEQRVGGVGADVIGIGHSNGGLVTRQWIRQHAASGVITVGTPHRGAPIVSNLYAYAGFNGGILESINRVYRAFGEGCCSWQFVLSAYTDLWQLIASASVTSLWQIAASVAVNTALPVSPEMIPGSGFLLSINSSDNLAREAANIPIRAGIVSTAHNFYWGGPLRAAFPDDGDLLAYLRDIARIGMDFWAAYLYANASIDDWQAFDIADGLMTGAYYLRFMDEVWCQAVSVVGFGACWLNDTLVPQWSQVYPGGVVVDTGWEGPAHTQETRLSDVFLDHLLTTYLGVPRRSTAPPAGAEAAFYEHVGLEGESVAMSADQAFVGWEWNDRISSVHVPAGRTVLLYEHADFGGESLAISSDAFDLRQYPGPGPDGTWNDAVSSVLVR